MSMQVSYEITAYNRETRESICEEYSVYDTAVERANKLRLNSDITFVNLDKVTTIHNVEHIAEAIWNRCASVKEIKDALERSNS
jgi:hypothetical protein